jgi:hypothetical protein
MVDLVLAGFVTLLLGLVFFLYLMLRRTVVNFREGMRGGDRKRE